MIVYGCQLNIAWEDKPANFACVRSMLRRRRISPKSLIVLPELFATGFTMNAADIAEPMNGPTAEFLRELAAERRSWVLGGFARQAGQNVYNEAVCIAPSGEILGRYAKLHPFSPGGESDHYSAGHNLTIFPCGNLKVAVFICYDLRFPEVFRAAVAQGAEAIVVIANWPDQRHSHWTALLRARAIENQAYVIGVNRCGCDPKLDYAGGSVVFDPNGREVVLAGSRESIVSANLDPKIPSQWRNDFPVLKDIRPDFLRIATGRGGSQRRSRPQGSSAPVRSGSPSRANVSSRRATSHNGSPPRH
ncbi:MAG TPA: carbon-nitrogen family hydrolase [Verrucomicrobiae bacterium]|nr:carbon-nitrogen family hydrolase [Verrucomicrobiae bacterium]